MKLASFIGAAFLLLATSEARGQAGQRPLTVQDAVEFRSLAHPYYFINGGWLGRTAIFSHDGSNFAVALRRGDLTRGVNLFELFIYRSAEVNGGNRTPFRRLTFESSSNRPGVHQLTWRSDNQTLYFVAEGAGGSSQVTRLDTSSGEMRPLTSSTQPVTSFAISDDESVIAYVAEAAWVPIWTNENRLDGVVVEHQSLVDLIRGRSGYRFRGIQDEFDLFVQTGGIARRVEMARHLASGARPALSSDGTQVIVTTRLRLNDVPAAWRSSSDQWMSMTSEFDNRNIAQESWFTAYEHVNLRNDEARYPVNAPTFSGVAAVFVRAGRAAVLDLQMQRIQAEAMGGRAEVGRLVEVDLRSGRVTSLPSSCAEAIRWDERSSTLLCHDDTQSEDQEVREVRLRRSREGWELARTEPSEDLRPIVRLTEDFRHAPRLLVRNRNEVAEHELLSLNPALADADLGRVEHIEWEGPDGRTVSAGLFYPADYEEGRSYPLIIQTHGWIPSRFYVEGMMGAGFVARPLAARGFFVLQLDEMRHDYGQALQQQRELDTAIEIYRQAIDRLGNQGLVDRNRVGVIGWSRTCWFVKHALAHTNLFAAASVIEGEEGGYLQYVTGQNAYVDPYSVYGGPPYGASLSTWIEESPAFNLHHVRAPIRITVLDPHFLLGDWEWFHGLSDLNKPVELVMFPNADHFPQRPRERLAIGQANVDWFAFWLQDYEDPDPSKRAQYARWRELRP